MNDTAPAHYTLYPLTAFDVLYERTTFVTGWLVQGTIDAIALAAALTRVTEKWRMLAGRLTSKRIDKTTEWYLRIPLGFLPPDYPTFSLTTTISEHPLVYYVSVPFEPVTQSLPPNVFIHPSTPRKYSVWEGNDHPLTCWHLTYFPANSANNGQAHTCIGFSRSHGLFDGGGAALVMRALVAELNGQDWKIPPLPPVGVSVNPVKECLEREVQAQEASHTNYSDYAGMAMLGIPGALKLAYWHLREKWWRGARRQIILLPKSALSFLVDHVRKDIRRENKNVDAITTGDILAAWLLKTVYSQWTSPETIVNCGNLASFRHLIPSTDNSDLIDLYPHNAFIPLPYPTFSVADLNATPLGELTCALNTARASYSLNHVGQGYKLVKKSVTTFLVSPHAHENLLISNVSASRILESDWTAIGAKRIVCGYRYQITPNELLLTNSVFIAGRLDDGSTVLDVTLNKQRAGLLVEEVKRVSSLGSRHG